MASYDVFTADYINYLSKYSNNILSFAKPEALPINFTQKEFGQYYFNFVGEPLTLNTKKQSISFAKKIKPYFEKEGLDEKANLNLELNYNLDTTNNLDLQLLHFHTTTTL